MITDIGKQLLADEVFSNVEATEADDDKGETK